MSERSSQLPKNTKIEEHPSIKLVLDYLRHVRAYSEHTLLAYRTDLGQFLSFLESKHWLDLFPEQIVRSHILDFITALDADGLRASSVARKVAALRTFFRRLHRIKEIAKNPMKDLRGPQQERRTPKVLSRSEVNRLLGYNYAEGIWEARDQAIMEMLYGTGMRLQELTNLDVDDINFDEQTVSIRGNRSRSLPLSDTVAGLADCYLDFRSSHGQSRRFDKKALFISRFGSRLSSRSIHRILDKRTRLVGLMCSVSPQILRNSFARHALESGRELKQVRHLMGHSSAETTKLYLPKWTTGRQA